MRRQRQNNRQSLNPSLNISPSLTNEVRERVKACNYTEVIRTLLNRKPETGSPRRADYPSCLSLEIILAGLVLQ